MQQQMFPSRDGVKWTLDQLIQSQLLYLLELLVKMSSNVDTYGHQFPQNCCIVVLEMRNGKDLEHWTGAGFF